MRRPPPPPKPSRPVVIESDEARFSETLWFKLGEIETDETDDPTPLPLPLSERYATSDPLPLDDRQRFSLNNHVPPAPRSARRATSIVEPYSDDDLARYAVRRGVLGAVARRPLTVAVGVVALAVTAGATLALTGGDSRSAASTAVANDSSVESPRAPLYARADGKSAVLAAQAVATGPGVVEPALAASSAVTANRRGLAPSSRNRVAPKQAVAKATRAAAKRSPANRTETTRATSKRLAAKRSTSERVAAKPSKTRRSKATRSNAKQSKATRSNTSASKVTRSKSKATRSKATRSKVTRSKVTRSTATRSNAKGSKARRSKATRSKATRSKPSRAKTRRAKAKPTRSKPKSSKPKRGKAKRGKAKRGKAKRGKAKRATPKRRRRG